LGQLRPERLERGQAFQQIMTAPMSHSSLGSNSGNSSAGSSPTSDGAASTNQSDVRFRQCHSIQCGRNVVDPNDVSIQSSGLLSRPTHNGHQIPTALLAAPQRYLPSARMRAETDGSVNSVYAEPEFFQYVSDLCGYGSHCFHFSMLQRKGTEIAEE
jgi:hypothetical protein